MSISLSDYENGFNHLDVNCVCLRFVALKTSGYLKKMKNTVWFGDVSFLTEASQKKLGSLVLGLKLRCRGKSKKTQKTKSNAKLNAKSIAKPNANSNEKSMAESNAKSKTYAIRAEPHTPTGWRRSQLRNQCLPRNRILIDFWWICEPKDSPRFSSMPQEEDFGAPRVS